MLPRGEGPVDIRKASQETAPSRPRMKPLVGRGGSGGHLPSSQEIPVDVLTNETLMFSSLKILVQKV